MQSGRGIVDGFGPPVVVDPVHAGHVPAQRVVGLALILTMRAQAVRHTAGVDVVREQEGDIESACRNTCPRRRRSCERRGEAGDQGATGDGHSASTSARIMEHERSTPPFGPAAEGAWMKNPGVRAGERR
jgi:hypothetical protein